MVRDPTWIGHARQASCPLCCLSGPAFATLLTENSCFYFFILPKRKGGVCIITEEASLILTPAAGPKLSPPALAGLEDSMGPNSGKDREIPKGPRSQGIWSSAGAWMRSECAGGEQREGAELGGGGTCPLGVLSSSAPFLGVSLLGAGPVSRAALL